MLSALYWLLSDLGTAIVEDELVLDSSRLTFPVVFQVDLASAQDCPAALEDEDEVAESSAKSKNKKTSISCMVPLVQLGGNGNAETSYAMHKYTLNTHKTLH